MDCDRCGGLCGGKFPFFFGESLWYLDSWRCFLTSFSLLSFVVLVCCIFGFLWTDRVIRMIVVCSSNVCRVMLRYILVDNVLLALRAGIGVSDHLLRERQTSYLHFCIVEEFAKSSDLWNVSCLRVLFLFLLFHNVLIVDLPVDCE